MDCRTTVAGINLGVKKINENTAAVAVRTDLF